MTPTTLRGWMEVLDYVTGALIRSWEGNNLKVYARHYDLWYWIQKRIIAKYGD